MRKTFMLFGVAAVLAAALAVAPFASASPHSAAADVHQAQATAMTVVPAALASAPTRAHKAQWNPGRSICTSLVTGGIFAAGYWTISRVAGAGDWIAGHFVQSGVLRQALGFFSWPWVYNLIYNSVCANA